MAPCVWCTDLTDTRAETPGRPDLGELPLHVWCAGAVVAAYRRWLAGEVLAAGTLALLEGYHRRLLAIASSVEAGRAFASELEVLRAETEVDEATRAKMTARLELFGGYTVRPHDDSCPALSGDVAGCRCVV